MDSRFRADGSATRAVREMHPGRRVMGDDLPSGVRTYGGALRVTTRNAIVWFVPGRAPSGQQGPSASRTPVSQTSSE